MKNKMLTVRMNSDLFTKLAKDHDTYMNMTNQDISVQEYVRKVLELFSATDLACTCRDANGLAQDCNVHGFMLKVDDAGTPVNINQDGNVYKTDQLERALFANEQFSSVACLPPVEFKVNNEK